MNTQKELNLILKILIKILKKYKNDKDDEDFEIKAEIDSGTTGLEEERDYLRAMRELDKSKKKLKEDIKNTKKEKRIFRNKGAKKK